MSKMRMKRAPKGRTKPPARTLAELFPFHSGSAGCAAEATKTGGAYRDRTDDPLLAKQVLSQLS
jgi:hypothetical protein